MSVKLSPFNKVQIGLEVLGNEAYSMKQNLEAKTEIGVLPDGTNLWQTWLDSRTIRLHGGTNGDQRQRFKDDHSFDLASIVNADLSSDSSIPISEETYLKSQGAEFIVILKEDVNGAEVNYAIRADKYLSIRDQLNKRVCDVEALEKAGGFKIDVNLTTKEVKTSDGWLESNVERNQSSPSEYALSSRLLSSYVDEAERLHCFPDSTGMRFSFDTSKKGYRAESLYIFSSGSRSGIGGRRYWNDTAQFVTRAKDLAESDPQKSLEFYRAGNMAEALRALSGRDAKAFRDIAAAYYNQKEQQ